MLRWFGRYLSFLGACGVVVVCGYAGSAASYGVLWKYMVEPIQTLSSNPQSAHNDIWFFALLLSLPFLPGMLVGFVPFRLIAALGWDRPAGWPAMLLLWLLAVTILVASKWLLLWGAFTPLERLILTTILVLTLGFALTAVVHKHSARQHRRRVEAQLPQAFE